MNTLYYGDNLEVLRKHIQDESVDLIYLDPPFNSARNYNLLFKQHKGQSSPAQIMAFEDTWTFSYEIWNDFKADQANGALHNLMDALFQILGASDMMAYLLMMAPRLLDLHRILKSSGSLYLHCDPVASHYLKIVLDVVFGPDKFKNEITWKRTNTHNDAKKRLANVADTILFYSKSRSGTTFNPLHLDHDLGYVKSFYRHKDDRGTYRLHDITSPNPRPNLMYTLVAPDGRDFPPPRFGWRFSKDTMASLIEDNRIQFPLKDGGRPQVKRYLHEMKGSPLGSVWDDILPVQSQALERRGYPTQKPLALLERIIALSSNEGDVIMDPFAGCGTAVVAAERMGRKWVGIDITYLAISEVVDRLRTEHIEGRELEFKTIGTPKDGAGAEALFESTKSQNHKPFEQWAVSLVGGRWNDKRGADRGIDGRIGLHDAQGSYREALVQVKGGNALTLSAVRDFSQVISRENAILGIMLAMKPPTKEMLLEAGSMGMADWHTDGKYPKLQILYIPEMLEKGVRAHVPESYRIKPQVGVGRKVLNGQTSLEE